MKITLILSLLLIVTVSFTSEKKLFDLQLVIQQNGMDHLISDDEMNITLDRAQFSIFFNAKKYDSAKEKFYATRIAVLNDKKDFDLMKAGVNAEDVSYFSSGTGYASDGPYDAFTFNDGNQYIFYDENGEQRAALVNDDHGILRLKCEVRNFFIHGTEISISASDVKTFYMVVFSDMNLNEKIDKGEFRKLKITFN